MVLPETDPKLIPGVAAAPALKDVVLIGKIFSMDYVLKNVLRMTDLQVEQQREQIKKEIEDGLIKDPYNDDANNNY